MRIALEWFLNPDHAPLVLARHFGWLAAEGLELDLLEPREHFDAFAGLQAGEVDLAITEPIHLMQDVARGERLVGFARFLHTNGGVMYLRGRGVTRPRDLARARLQYPGAPGPGGLAILETMIRADGGQPEALVPVNNGFFHTDALVQGKADAATLAFYNFEVVEARNKGYDADFFALRDWGVPDFCQLVLVALPETLDHRAAEVASLVRVLRRGIDFLRQHPGEAHRIWNQETGTDPEDRLFQAIWHATTPHFVYDFMLADAYWERLSRWLVETGQIPAPVDGSEVWTNRFA